MKGVPWVEGSSVGRKGGGGGGGGVVTMPSAFQQRGYPSQWNERNTTLSRWFRWKSVSWWGGNEQKMRLCPPTSDPTLQMMRGSLTDFENLWLIWPAPISPPLTDWGGGCFKIEDLKTQLIFCLSYQPHLHLCWKEVKRWIRYEARSMGRLW